MPRQLALFLTCAFVFYLFRRDVKQKPDISGALWIPLIWVLIAGSRPVSVWLSIIFGITVPGSLEDGSPVDRTVFMALIAAGMYVLARRRTSVIEFVTNNAWITIYLIYCFIAIAWSDYAFVSFKRWIRSIGEPVMVLVLLTELNRSEAIIRLIKRATYVLAPFSIMLIKYFPEIGKRYSAWGGGESGGITGGKNALGHVCMILGFFLFCHLLKTFKLERSVARRDELLLTAVLLWTVWWNLIEANSSTALMSLVVGMLMVIALGRPIVSKRFVGAYIFVAVAIIFAADAAFGLYEGIISLLGRDSSLTGRTELWTDLLSMGTNPVIGVGFESFWLGERLRYLWSRHWWMPNEAHNGYLETYLNLGSVGVALVLCMLFATYRKSRRELLTNFEFGRMRMGYLAVVVVYNWTEAGFRILHLVLLMFYLVAIDYPMRQAAEATEPLDARGKEPGADRLRLAVAGSGRPSGFGPRPRPAARATVPITQTDHENRVYRPVPGAGVATAEADRAKSQPRRQGKDRAVRRASAEPIAHGRNRFSR